MNASKRLSLGVVIACLALLGGAILGGTAATAKKKKKGSSSVTVTKSTPTVIPPGTAPSGGPPPTTAGKVSLVAIPLVVGKKAKGKVVSLDSLTATYSLTGSTETATVDGSLSQTGLSVTAPNGRTVFLNPPAQFGDTNTTATGPTTESPNSSAFPCSTDQPAPAPSPFRCSPFSQQDPEGTLVPPTYAGTQSNVDLAWFGGVPAKGTWTVKARNRSTTGASTLTNVSLNIGLTTAPSSSSKKKK